MRRTVVLSASAALAVFLVGMAMLLWTQQAQAEEVCQTEGNANCLAKTADRSTVTVGEQITFTITQRCLGAGCVVGFGSLVDTLPSGLTVDSVDHAGPLLPAGYECSTSGNTVTCPAPRFTTQEQPFTLTIVATPTECGSFTNTASTAEHTVETSFTVEGCPPSLPMTKAECKNGGWMVFGYPDQGTCISDVNQRTK